jgi:hypothetical protein
LAISRSLFREEGRGKMNDGQGIGFDLISKPAKINGRSRNIKKPGFLKKPGFWPVLWG